MTVSAAELLGWYDVARRDLPWREPGVTAWQILVSEFMLQQTPVSRVPRPNLDPQQATDGNAPTSTSTGDAGAGDSASTPSHF